MTEEKTPEKRATSQWIELIVLLGMLIVITWLAFARPPGAVPEHHHDSAWLFGHAGMLEKQLQDFQVKAKHYLDNAPRDYDAYFRDSTISHSHLKTDLQSLDAAVLALTGDSAGANDSSDGPASENTRPSNLPVDRLQEEWTSFQRVLEEQLGVDPEMPRLEWGSRHIVEHLDPVIATVGEIRERSQAAAGSANTPSVSAPAWAWPALLAWMVLVLVWFGRHVRHARNSI